MKIAILTIGSRGDVQPMVALGVGLKHAGHEVRLVAGTNFEDWVRSYGLDFLGTVDLEAVMQSDAAYAWTEGGDNPLKQLKQMKKIADNNAEALGDALYRAATESELMIGGLLSNPFALAIQEKFGIPAISAMLQPYHPTQNGRATLVPILPERISIVNRWIGYFAENLMWNVFKEGLNTFRTHKLNLPSLTRGEYIRQANAMPTLHAFSAEIVPTPDDWGAHLHTTGYWFLDANEDWQAPDDLQAFINGGEKPVYIGFGSMASRDPDATLRLIIDALQRTGQRGIIASGWTEATNIPLPDTVFLLDAAPHDWLFPQMAGVVHHGGAGTTAAGLRAGVPTMIIPHLGDQPYWGRRVHELRAGVKPVPRPDLTAEKLALGIKQLITDPTLRINARDLGQKIRAETGIDNAVKIINERYA